MKKIILLFAMILVVGTVSAKTYNLYAKFGSVINNNNVSWDASDNTLKVWGNEANTYQMFSFAAGTLKKYNKIHIQINDKDHTRILFMANGETKYTWFFGQNGEKNSVIVDIHNDVKNNLDNIDEIRIGGYEVSSYTKDNPCEISINPADVYLESPEYDGNTTAFSSLTTNGTWSSTLTSLPVAVSSGLLFVGKDNGVSDYADISDYHAIIFKITDFITQGGGKIRAFLCNENDENLTTYYAYPITDANVSDWKAEKGPTGNGYYYIDVSSFNRLVGIKTNNYNTASNWKIAEVYLVKKNITITDGFDIADLVNDQVGASVCYDRKFTIGQKSTVCLPFALSETEASSAGDFYELSDQSTEEKLRFEKVTTTVAYKPYVFVAKAETPFTNLTNKEIVETPTEATNYAVTQSVYTFQGTLAHQSLPSGVYGYNSGTGRFSKTTSDKVTIDAFRAYITTNSTSSGAKSFIDAEFLDGETTGIESIHNDTQHTDANTKSPMYNLAGQRVGEGYKGIVIRNGKKYIAR